MTSQNDQFKDYVTGGAFQLSLSKRQAEMLSHIDQMGSTWGHLSTFGALESKGLVKRIQSEQAEEGNDSLAFKRVCLTEAGIALIPLLKIAGVYSEIPKHECLELPPPRVTLKGEREQS